MSKGTYNQFFNRLGLLESGDNYFLTGSDNELGRYQLDEAALMQGGLCVRRQVAGRE